MNKLFALAILLSLTVTAQAGTTTTVPNPIQEPARVSKTFQVPKTTPKAIESSNDKWGENIYRLEAPKGYRFYKAGKGYLLIANEVQK